METACNYVLIGGPADGQLIQFRVPGEARCPLEHTTSEGARYVFHPTAGVGYARFYYAGTVDRFTRGAPEEARG